LLFPRKLNVMGTQDSNQYSKPDNTPKRDRPEPKMPGKEEDKGIIRGANQQDQLDKLQPEKGEKKAPRDSGSEPVKDAGE